MFAGIYYGAMYGGSTTSILLNTPGESGSMMTAVEGNKMARAGRAAAALATAAIGSFIAGTIATLLLAFVAPYVVNVAILLGPGRLPRPHRGRLHDRRCAAGRVACPRIRQRRPRPGDRLDRVRRTERRRTLHVRHPAPARRRQHRGHHRGAVRHGGGHLPGRPHAQGQAADHGDQQGSSLDDPRGLEAVVAGVAARHAHRLAARRRSRRRLRGPHLPLLCGGEEAEQAQGRVRPRRHRRRRRSRGREQRECRRCPDAAARPRPADDGDRRRDPRRFPAVRHPTRAACSWRRSRTSSGVWSPHC